MDEPIDQSELTPEATIAYPDVSDRIRAAIADTFAIIGFMLILSFVFSLFDDVPDNARIISFIFVFGLYDPLFTSIFGGTIGHIVMNIRVKRIKHPEKNVIFPLALIRYIVKITLGWVSLLTVSNNAKKLAIHDMAIGSIVVHKNQ